jgi:hypothetical protein
MSLTISIKGALLNCTLSIQTRALPNSISADQGASGSKTLLAQIDPLKGITHTPEQAQPGVGGVITLSRLACLTVRGLRWK